MLMRCGRYTAHEVKQGVINATRHTTKRLMAVAMQRMTRVLHTLTHMAGCYADVLLALQG